MIKNSTKGRNTSVLGLFLDGGRLDGAWCRKINGKVEVRKTFSTPLSVDLMSVDPELASREIRNHLDNSGIKERNCIVAFPSEWATTLQTKVTEIPDEDLNSFLLLEGERGFPYSLDSLITTSLLHHSPKGDRYATQFAVNKEQLTRLETVLLGAKLKPFAFTLGLHPIVWSESPNSAPALYLDVHSTKVSLVISSGGGVPMLRTLQGVHIEESIGADLKADQISRELRISLGQLVPDIRDSLQSMRIIGGAEKGQKLTRELRAKAESWGLNVEWSPGMRGSQLDLAVPPTESFGIAASLAARVLAQGNIGSNFLPPRTSPWQEFIKKHSAKKLALLGAAAAFIAGGIGIAFAIQHFQLSTLSKKWSKLGPRVQQIEDLQSKIRQYRPWFDENYRSLTILRTITEAFPEDGSMVVKSIELRENSVISCSGTARDTKVLHAVMDQLRASKGVTALNQGPSKGTQPVSYSFDFRWNDGGNL